MEKNVYIGKATGNGTETAICKVLYSDIRSGAAVVFNRATGKYDTVKCDERISLSANIRKLADDTEHKFA